MLPLDFSHREQTVDQFSSAAFARVTRGGFVFHNVPAFEPARAIHRGKPAGDVTQQAKQAANQCRSQLAAFVWASAETGQHLADQPAMMPLFVLDLLYFRSILRVAKRLPVSAISVSGCQFAGVGELQNLDQLTFGS